MNRTNVGAQTQAAGAECRAQRSRRTRTWLRPGAHVAIATIVGLACARDAAARLKCAHEGSSMLATLPAVKVAPTTPLDTVLWSASGLTMRADCGRASPVGPAENAWVYRRELDLGNGMSLYLTYGSNKGDTEALMNTGVSVRNWHVTGLRGTEVSAQVSLELVKTGTTPASGTLTSLLPSDSIIFASIGSGSPDHRTDGANFYLYGLRNVGFVPSTCTVNSKSVQVNLGQASLGRAGGFGSAVGSTSAAKDFSVDLTCDTAATGTYGVFMQLAGTTAAGLADSGVLQLGAGSSATGLGIQVLRGSAQAQTPVQFNKAWQIGSFPMTSARLLVPFSARYYQTAPNVTPGTANGTATFTITYQ
jgi:major type 1 subunit fimbrin (pilin)